MKSRAVLLILAALALLLWASSAEADEIWAEVDGFTVTVYHLDAYYNCCWFLAADIDVSAPIVDLYEVEGPGSEYCLCYCSFDLSFEFEIPQPGEYLLRVWYYDTYGNDEWVHVLAAELPIVIEAPGGGAPDCQVAQSDCGGWPTGLPPVSDEGFLRLASGTLRVLYR